MKAYITGSGIISPQETFSGPEFPKVIRAVVSDRLLCIEPDYHSLIHPLQLRRMPRILKMGLASARLSVKNAGMDPDAIIVGTGLGCLENLEKFLTEVLNSGEHITSVLPFINSTHNAVAAQIAMQFQSHGYNLTYCHRSFSFESALDDALLHLEEQTCRNVLVGGIDECTSDFMRLHSYLNYWKKPVSNLSLTRDMSPGTIAGEGSAFFMLSAEPASPYQPAVEGVHTFFTPAGAGLNDIIPEIESFLHLHGTGKHEVNLVLTGMNGDSDFDWIYRDLDKNYFAPETGIALYKNLCGEYYTSTAFALWLGSVILMKQDLLVEVQLKAPAGKSINKLLIYNQFRNKEHALILMSHGKI